MKPKSRKKSKAAKKHKKSKEKRCRNNITTFLNLLGFQDDHPTVTTKFLLQKLPENKPKESTAVIKRSRITRVTFKFRGESSVIQLDPTTVLEPPHSDDNGSNNNIGEVEVENPNSDDQMVMNEDNGDHGIIEDHPVNDDDDVGEGLRDFIRNMGGSLESIVLVIEKRLTKTDVSSNQGRLLMPLSQDKYQDFLTALENEKLNGEEDMNVRMFDPRFQESAMNLRLWKMKQQYLVLKTQWNKVVAANKFKENTVLKVWSFRVNEQLCIALVRV